MFNALRSVHRSKEANSDLNSEQHATAYLINQPAKPMDNNAIPHAPRFKPSVTSSNAKMQEKQRASGKHQHLFFCAQFTSIIAQPSLDGD
jgi:hypothetical protein